MSASLSDRKDPERSSYSASTPIFRFEYFHADGLGSSVPEYHLETGTTQFLNSFGSKSTAGFPTAKTVASADAIGIGMPKERQEALKALAEVVVTDSNLFDPFRSIEESVATLRRIRGVGEWTAQYIALRAIRQTDAFPATDVGLLRGAASLDGIASTSIALLDRAESWRPWRAYPAQHIWAANSMNI